MHELLSLTAPPLHCDRKRATLGRLITSQRYQTSAYNPLWLAITISIRGVAALVACLSPARRASLIKPIDALRIE